MLSPRSAVWISYWGTRTVEGQDGETRGRGDWETLFTRSPRLPIPQSALRSNEMTFSPQLEARFAKLLTSYPPGRQRSAMVPILLYAQDEVGHVSDELVDEVAHRVGATPLQVTEVLSYYSMLHRPPLGK